MGRHVGAGVDEGGDDAQAHLTQGRIAALGQAHAAHVRDQDVNSLKGEAGWEFGIYNSNHMKAGMDPLRL